MVLEGLNKLLGSGLTQDGPERRGSLNCSGSELLPGLFNLGFTREVGFVTFAADQLYFFLVGATPVSVRDDATLPCPEVINHYPQAAPFPALLVGYLRPPPVQKCIKEGIIATEIVDGIEQGSAIRV